MGARPGSALGPAGPRAAYAARPTGATRAGGAGQQETRVEGERTLLHKQSQRRATGCARTSATATATTTAASTSAPASAVGAGVAASTAPSASAAKPARPATARGCGASQRNAAHTRRRISTRRTIGTTPSACTEWSTLAPSTRSTNHPTAPVYPVPARPRVEIERNAAPGVLTPSEAARPSAESIPTRRSPGTTRAATPRIARVGTSRGTPSAARTDFALAAGVAVHSIQSDDPRIAAQSRPAVKLASFSDDR